jgi:hypothetical protein
VPVALLLSILILATESGLAPAPTLPACTAAKVGELWPEEANKDRKLAAKLAHCGELRICTRASRHYRWDSPTIRADQLSKRPGLPIPAECRDNPADETPPSPLPVDK